MDQDHLARLAALVKERNRVEVEIAAIINRPAQLGHVGEYIAAHIFDLTLHPSAANKGSDGHFNSGPVAGRSVNVKWYGKQEGLLDINLGGLPDYYLVLAGPRGAPVSSKGMARPWVINSVFLFDVPSLLQDLRAANVKIGIATSIRSAVWHAAEVYPVGRNATIPLSNAQRAQLMLFSEALAASSVRACRDVDVEGPMTNR
jgi:hypothetical protein